MSYKKPQTPLQHKDGDYFYPLTTIDQIIMEDGITRLNGADLVSVNTDGAPEGETARINADTLGGYPADEYVRHNDDKFIGVTPKAGFIYPLATSVVPSGFLLCDGAEYSRGEYPELFAAIGTVYGEGDGSTTFNVPDLQTRVPVGTGTGYTLGATGGEEKHILTSTEMPAHSHAIFNVQSGVPMSVGCDGPYAGSQYAGFSNSIAALVDTTYGISNTGGSQPHNNMQPYTVVNYIIATGKDTGVSVHDIITGAQALPLGIEYGGIGATNAADARRNLEITPENIGAMKMELLWENASPGSQFASQTVVCNISEYDFVYIDYFESTLNSYHGSVFFHAGFAATLDLIDSNGRIIFRQALPVYDGSSPVGFTFSGAFISGQPDNNYIIPYRIYGIKGVSK